ncbi:hypothetical protein G4Z05_00450 [Bacillus thermocopriae]|jgi:uncharacterized protein YjhX (UPF0386 family)|uniref:Uncharacterized protein n=1 Tax=Neobacillus thermocopriae TaxID=1215031 RepID=A0A6B3TL79_9BACI|nr:hypothetical protein [Neobacillus thermocopriae]NEX77372.1 hypothetical protein [Neobacillus thermocopriae]
MAKLSDLVNVNINRDTIKIQDVDIPVIFTMKSFPFVEEAYGKPYHIFEKDLNRMLQKGTVKLGKNETRLMSALIYAMVRSGGTECTPKELEGSIPISDLSGVFQTVLNIFNNQMFQKEDMDKMKTEKKN